MTEQSMWRTLKPYPLIAVVVVGLICWYYNESPIAHLRDGRYDCTVVFVNDAGDYDVIMDSSGNLLHGSATVEGSELIALSGEIPLDASQVAALTVRSKGNSHFHAADDPPDNSYQAFACDYAGQ